MADELSEAQEKPQRAGTTADRQREAKRKWAAGQSAAVREIGPIPAIQDVARRERCRLSLRLFCETYNPEPFYLAWSRDHLDAIARIEEAALHGALYAFAIPRGSGKSSLVRTAAAWALSYRHCRYPYLIGSNAGKAEEAMDLVKTIFRFLTPYWRDFPEIAHPIRRLGGLAIRAGGQTCQGEPTMIEWAKDRVVLPTVPPPPNWPSEWPLRGDGMAPTSGSVIYTSGLKGEGIRGSVHVLTSGEVLRPDLVLLDDPQTPGTARSPSQNEQREQLIAADLLGLSGPDKPISAVMPCTVIFPDDLADRLLDRDKHPLWRGDRRGILRSMPKNLDAWEAYNEVYVRCAQKKPPDFAEANDYYLAHRETLDEGAEASWAEKRYPGEVSAIQHAMHLYFRDPSHRAFWSEAMNAPLPLVEPSTADLDAEEVMVRVNQLPRGAAPPWAQRLTAGIDVQKDLLYYCVCAWGEGYTGAVVDYGAWPDQRRAYFGLRDARPTIGDATGVKTMLGALWAGLTALTGLLLGREWGPGLRVERCLIDSGGRDWPTLVKRFCTESAHAGVLLPSKGFGIGPTSRPMSDWAKKDGERRDPHGGNWIVTAARSATGRLLIFDANVWKSFLSARLKQPLGEPGALTLYGKNPLAHRMLADHLASEYSIRGTGQGRTLDVWKRHLNRDNHLLDTTVLATVAASERGAAPPGMPAVPVKERKRVSFATLQQKANGG